MKSKSIKILEQISLDYKKAKYPNTPERYLYPRKFNDKKANDLTKAIIYFIEYMNYQAERISVTGRKVASSKKVRDTFTGEIKTVGKDKYIKSSMKKGSADISAIIKNDKGNVIPWKIEVKIGKDRQSVDQKEYEKVIKKSGGHYSIVRDFDDFYKQYKELTNDKNLPDL